MATRSGDRPKLRAIDVQPVTHYGRPSFYLRDPLQLSDKMVVLPRELGALLVLCDGRHDAEAIRDELWQRYGLPVQLDLVRHVLQALDEAYLLLNDTHLRAYEAALAAYRAQPFRTAALAGGAYPATAAALRRRLDAYLAAAASDPVAAAARGLVSPHIDYARGGPIYAQVWQRAARAARDAEIAIIFGTDHYGDALVTLTRQHYATPYGVLPTARDVVDRLAASMGPESVYRGELRHRTEHSVELAAVWLHHMRGGQPCSLVPLLCGSFHHYVQNSGGPGADGQVRRLLETLRRATAGQRVLVVAAADLAHIGPAFGGNPVDEQGRTRLQQADDGLIAQMVAGDAEGFFAQIKQVQDCNNVCGMAPIYLALRLLEPVRGETAGYDRCAADDAGTSLVSICGVVFE